MTSFDFQDASAFWAWNGFVVFVDFFGKGYRDDGKQRWNGFEQTIHGLVVVMVMDVGIMRVGMHQAGVLMAMGVRFAWRISGRVIVLVVLVVVMKVLVLDRLVNVPMLVAFGNVQPDAYEHKNARNAERPIESTMSEGEGKRCAFRGRSVFLRPRAGCL